MALRSDNFLLIMINLNTCLPQPWKLEESQEILKLLLKKSRKTDETSGMILKLIYAFLIKIFVCRALILLNLKSGWFNNYWAIKSIQSIKP